MNTAPLEDNMTNVLVFVRGLEVTYCMLAKPLG